MSMITIGHRKVGTGCPVLVVAELGGGHHRDYATAEALVRAAVKAGADCVKVQIYKPESLTLNSDAEPFQMRTGPWAGKTLWELYSDAAMPYEWLPALKAEADRLDIIMFGSVFDKPGIDLMVSLGVPAIKIASFECVDLPLIRAAALTGLPLILSTGMATSVEIAQALHAAEVSGADQCVLMKCTSAYPAPVSAANLRTIEHMQEWSGFYPIGLSDHSRSNATVCAAVALGASVIERHLTLDRAAGGPDAAFSDEPAEFAAMVRAIRDVEAALGTVHYGPTEAERPMLRFRRSIWITRDIAAGEVLTEENAAILRPADGLAPKHWDSVIGRRARLAILRGTPLEWEMIES